MTKKDFEMIAEILASAEHIAETSDFSASAIVRQTAEAFAKTIKEDHPRFNEAKFIAAALPRKSDRLKQEILRSLEGS